MADALLEARGVAVEFLRGTHVLPAVRGVDLAIGAGETLALVGESGSGKSSLALALLGVHRLARGTVLFRGTDLATLRGAARREFRRHVQPVLQDPTASLDPRWRIARSIEEPLRALDIGDAQTRAARVTSLLDAVGLPHDFAQRLPAALSGGQRQRVALARALAPTPSLLIADEPLAALDVQTQAQIVALLTDLQHATGVALLLVAHDLALVQRTAQRIAVLYLGRIVEQGPTTHVLSAPLHPYTRALLAATPSFKRTRQDAQRIILPGEPPSPLAIPGGCEFHPRCPMARERCKIERPLLLPHADAHAAACHFAGMRSSNISS